MADRSGQYLSSRKVRDQSTILLLLGLALLISPMAGIFQIDATLLGVPITLLYLFVVWAGLIFGAFLLARRLIGDSADDKPHVGDDDAHASMTAPDTDTRA